LIRYLVSQSTKTHPVQSFYFHVALLKRGHWFSYNFVALVKLKCDVWCTVWYYCQF